jgi:glucokinase
MSAVIGVDIGGTAVKMGLVSAQGSVLAKKKVSLDPGGTFPEFIRPISSALNSLMVSSGEPVEAIGFATPGYADRDTGTLIDGTQNVPALKGRSLPKEFSKRFRVPSFIDNDGTCAALGELRFGAGRKLRSFVVITLGTGIGGGVVVNREIVTGAKGTPPEIGAICLDPNGPVNYSGVPGTFEQLACASGIEGLYRRLSRRGEIRLSPREIFGLAIEGEEAAKATVDQTGRYIAQAFGTMINLLNLEACIIGGGISASGQPLVEAIRKHLPSFTWPNLLRNTQVLLAELGNDAGVVGAAAMAIQRMSR